MFSQFFNITKSNIKIIYYYLSHLDIDTIIKLIFIFTKIKIPNSILKFFYKIYIFIKQIKYILKSPAIRILLFRKKIYIDLVRLIILIRYNSSKYNLFIIDNILYIIIK